MGITLCPTPPENKVMYSGASELAGNGSIQDGRGMSNSEVIEYAPDGRVKAATVKGLVKLASESQEVSRDSEFRKIFLISYVTFSNAEEILECLEERFIAASSTPHAAKQCADVRHSILTFLELWLRTDHTHIESSLLQQIKIFAPSVSAACKACGSHQLPNISEQLMEQPLPTLHGTLSLRTKSSMVPLAGISPRDFALALTLTESERFREIRPWDLIAWLEGDNRVRDRVTEFEIENKKLSYCIRRFILKPDVRQERISHVEYFLSVQAECRKLCNFSSACAIGNALDSFITGLKRSFGLDAKRLRPYEDIKKLMSITKNFKEYRTSLHACGKPCLPWLYVHLHDLKIVHRYHPKLIWHGGTPLINFHRYRRVYEFITKLLNYQNSSHYTGPIHRLPPEIQYSVKRHTQSIVVDEDLRRWINTRASTLKREEEISYIQRDDEKMRVGFTITPSRPQTSRYSTSPSDVAPIKLTKLTWDTLEGSPQGTENASLSVVSILDQNISEHQVKDILLDPRSKDCLDGKIVIHHLEPVDGGGYAEVREGFFGDKRVAIKTIRRFSTSGKTIDEPTLRKRLCREYRAWISVSEHSNILDCLGFSYDIKSEPYDIPSLISPWMSNGTVFSYLRKYPSTDLLELLTGIARGLAHIHKKKFIHGDLRAGNILVSDAGVPLLSDFGLSRIFQVEEMTTTSGAAGTTRWMSPELLHGMETGSLSSDVWAFGMTVLEIISGKVPYADKALAVATSNILHDTMPSRPDTMTDEVWNLCMKCWVVDPRQRPSMQTILSTLDDMVLRPR